MTHLRINLKTISVNLGPGLHIFKGAMLISILINILFISKNNANIHAYCLYIMTSCMVTNLNAA